MFQLFKKWFQSKQLSARSLQRVLNLYPPLWGAGIRIKHLSDDFHEATASMKLTRLNRNYWGSHYGGSLFSMTDILYALMLIHILGPRYLVWVHSAKIVFLKPARSHVHVRAQLDEQTIQVIRDQTAHGEKYLVEFPMRILDGADNVVATVEQVLYIRLKKEHRPI